MEPSAASFLEEGAQSCLKGISELSELDKACPETEKQSDADDADHGGDTPDKAVDCAVDLFDCFQHKNDSFLSD